MENIIPVCPWCHTILSPTPTENNNVTQTFHCRCHGSELTTELIRFVKDGSLEWIFLKTIDNERLFSIAYYHANNYCVIQHWQEKDNRKQATTLGFLPAPASPPDAAQTLLKFIKLKVFA